MQAMTQEEEEQLIFDGEEELEEKREQERIAKEQQEKQAAEDEIEPTPENHTRLRGVAVAVVSNSNSTQSNNISIQETSEEQSNKRTRRESWQEKQSRRENEQIRAAQLRRHDEEQAQLEREASNIVRFSRPPVRVLNGQFPTNVKVYDIRSQESFRANDDQWEGMLITNTRAIGSFLLNNLDCLIGYTHTKVAFMYLPGKQFIPSEFKFLKDILTDQMGGELKYFSLMMRSTPFLCEEAYDETRNKVINHIKSNVADEREGYQHRPIQLEHIDMVLSDRELEVLECLSEKSRTTVKYHSRFYRGKY